MAELWSDYTDMLITGIEKQAGTKFRLSLRSLLEDPTRYAAQQNIQITIDNMREEADKYIDEKIDALTEEQKNLDDAASRADSTTKQLGQNIISQARQNNIPVVKPVTIERDATKEERLTIDTFDNSIMSLVQKLVASSTLVADLGGSYKKYSIGSWLFSGSKNYLLSVYMPDSTLLLLETSRAELDNMLASASSFIKGL